MNFHIRQFFTAFLILLPQLLFFFPALAQEEEDSLKGDTTKFFYKFSELEMLNDSFPSSETMVFSNFQRYQPLSNDFPFFRVGNAGHVMYSPLLAGRIPTSDLSHSVIQAVDPYFDNRKNMVYYRNKPPFTSIAYMSGAKKEESIDVKHARNFGKNLNFSLHLGRNGSVGFYNHLRTRSSYFNLNLNYITANHRYSALTHYYSNKKELEENGGYQDFEQITNPETFGSSRLSAASNEIKEEGFLLSQTLGFGNTADDQVKFIRPLFRIGHDVHVISGRRLYEDQGNSGLLNTDVYKNIYFDSSFTTDTTEYNHLSNQFNLFVYPGQHDLKLYYRNEMISYNQNSLADTFYINQAGGALYSFQFLQKYESSLKGEYFFEGLRKGDMDLKWDFGNLKTDTSGDIRLNGQLYYELRNPQFRMLRYSSNNFYWNNDFSKSTDMGVVAGLSLKQNNITFFYGSTEKLIYYDTEALPAQYEGRISYFSALFANKVNWRNLYLDNKLTYQHTSEKTIFPLSEFMAFESIYYQNYMFNKVVLYQVGFDVFYFTGYNGLTYMPATADFHLQNSYTTGNYPFIDLFFAFRLKRAFFFLKMEHVNKGMSGENFYNIPGYPVPPRAFKWGLKWTMFD